MIYEIVDGKKILGRAKTLTKARVIAAKNGNVDVVGKDEKGKTVYSEWLIWADAPLGFNKPYGWSNRYSTQLNCYVERPGKKGVVYSKINPKTGQVISTSRAYKEYFYE